MTEKRVRYPRDYDGYRYDDPSAPLPPMVKLGRIKMGKRPRA